MFPCWERTRITLLGRGVGVLVVGFGEWADTIYCSLRTSWKDEVSLGEEKRRTTYEHSNHGIVVGIVDIIGEAFDYLEEASYEILVDEH